MAKSPLHRPLLTEAHIADAVATALAVTAKGKSVLDRSVAIGGAVLAIISLIFTIGVSWGRIVNLEQEVAALKAKTIQADVAISVQDKAMAVVNTRLEVIQRDVATLLGRTERAAGVSTR